MAVMESRLRAVLNMTATPLPFLTAVWQHITQNCRSIQRSAPHSYLSLVYLSLTLSSLTLFHTHTDL